MTKKNYPANNPPAPPAPKPTNPTMEDILSREPRPPPAQPEELGGEYPFWPWWFLLFVVNVAILVAVLLNV